MSNDNGFYLKNSNQDSSLNPFCCCNFRQKKIKNVMPGPKPDVI